MKKTKSIKKDGGVIKDWQIPQLPATQEQIDQVHPGKGAKPMLFTGTVVEDPTGRWKPGFHMRSSLIVSHNKKTGVVETLNTIYKLIGPEGDPVSEQIKAIGGKPWNVFY